MTIRQAGASDAGAVHALIRALAVYEKLEDKFQAGVADIAALLDSGACSALLVEHGTEAVGLALYYPTVLTFAGKRGLWLEDLFVQPDHRGKGHGLALLKALARITVEGGYGALEWNVLDWNTPSIDFYGQIGAEPQHGWTDQRLTGDALSALAA
ncbi:GNAT family N-acetyltransferase [Rhodovarius crocodyli]|uniref:GNAT family N-acetyltransferase n=1 Tax=Rhodovarius crocodyli TaxID=1979269 RepID=UPI001F0C7125|nr:GNAT family N-acetyltransferase [Rhodovarius crocodyli]